MYFNYIYGTVGNAIIDSVFMLTKSENGQQNSTFTVFITCGIFKTCLIKVSMNFEALFF